MTARQAMDEYLSALYGLQALTAAAVRDPAVAEAVLPAMRDARSSLCAARCEFADAASELMVESMTEPY